MSHQRLLPLACHYMVTSREVSNKDSGPRDADPFGAQHRVDAEGDQAGGDDAEEPGAVRLLEEGLERPVEPSSLFGVDVEGGLHQEESDHGEDHPASRHAEPADKDGRLLFVAGHLAELEVVFEVGSYRLEDLPQAARRADQPDEPNEPGAVGLGEERGCEVLRAAGTLAWAAR